MAVKSFKPYTPGRRQMTVSSFDEITASKPEKSLTEIVRRSGGRNDQGRLTVRHKGGGHKRLYRIIDFKRSKDGIPATVATIEYDPNRSARIALVNYRDGEKRYMIAPAGLRPGEEIVSGPEVEIKPGNALPLKNIPLGQSVFNVELKCGAGGQLARSAGVGAQLVAKEGDYATLRLPSGEMRKVHQLCYATIGAASNPDHANVMIGKAGRSRWLGIRPHNRGTTKNPVDHPMGGGEGRSGGGRHPCSPTGQKAKGLKTRVNKRTTKFIVRRRGKKTA